MSDFVHLSILLSIGPTVALLFNLLFNTDTHKYYVHTLRYERFIPGIVPLCSHRLKVKEY